MASEVLFFRIGVYLNPHLDEDQKACIITDIHSEAMDFFDETLARKKYDMGSGVASFRCMTDEEVVDEILSESKQQTLDRIRRDS